MQQIISHQLSSSDIFLKSIAVLSLLFQDIIQRLVHSLDKLCFGPQKDKGLQRKYRLYLKAWEGTAVSKKSGGWGVKGQV